MTKRIVSIRNIGLIAAVSVAACGAGLAYSGQALQKDAAITPTHAQAIALKAQRGRVTDMELEREAGGSGLRYSFDIKAAGATHEVGVDAKTGAVLENSIDGAHPD
ncbi:MAG: peptidase M4 [Acidiphilium sp. 37-64-53]|uniref:PepSY domain-containing protein n=1 Tax=Acidiphilium TaxID=522 RepID=UPI000BCF811E|nr:MULTISPECIES: PepSY domain-containing protein [Acidiphilium]OYW02741.1 MAG: peptidase M4 [Acidiphilium sp. 37-64-53]OZB29331.1 MAG: peptidase M4 [Acidiphilium sp. 34-64-41]HQT85362.1 PepSY domain-containing protein [Acidiphilium rubrum]